VGAGSYREIVYVRNATEAINVVALSYGNANVGKGDRILISKMEHHSNIVPWQMLAKRKGAILDYIEIEDGARIDMSDYKERLEKEPKIVSFTHASNVLGTINDAKKMTQMAHSAGAAVLVDGAQSAPHLPINLKDIGCDFFVLSGHKMLAPSGIGALIAKEDTLEKM
ncbi:MAG: aminotransferase class V-fold PLP-dependent enzyme, partial [Candidatus Micrarchaeota archaeon]|nr:aminotransferase class V-fold PLP-dependent enzyme [Candidatus Micrarchaeota archaeon]